MESQCGSITKSVLPKKFSTTKRQVQLINRHHNHTYTPKVQINKSNALIPT